MIIIAHRGLIFGPDPFTENHPDYIELALSLGFHVEVDLWVESEKLFLGHDRPQYSIDLKFLQQPGVIVHCKNIQALLYCRISNLHYFWHEHDTVTLTSNNWIWAYPGKQPIANSIAVLPEINHDDISQCFGICTDYCLEYKHENRYSNNWTDS